MTEEGQTSTEGSAAAVEAPVSDGSPSGQDDVSLHGHQAPDLIEGELVKITGQWEGITGRLDGLHQEVEGARWTQGLDTLSSVASDLRECGPLIDDVARRMGDGARALRDALAQTDGVGEKKSLTEQTPD